MTVFTFRSDYGMMNLFKIALFFLREQASRRMTNNKMTDTKEKMMKQRVTAFLLGLTAVCIILFGCNPKTMQAEESVPSLQVPEKTPSASSEANIPTTNQSRIDWNTAFRMQELPEGEVTPESVAFLKRNEDGSESVICFPKDEIGPNLPARLPRTHYYEQFMDPAISEELLPLLDYALYRDCRSICVASTSLSPALINGSEPFLSPTYFDTYSFRAESIRQYEQPDGQTLLFLRIDFENYREIRDKYRRLDGMNMANAFVDNTPDGLDDMSKMFRIYRWLTQTVQFYGSDGSSAEYYEKRSWSLLFDAMVMHIAVDAGYAETLTVICNLAGIECFTVKSPSHVWNIARIDGQYYCFDAACDCGLTPADFRYFGVSYDTLRRLHSADAEEPLPFYLEYGPSCQAELFPLPFDGGADENTPAAKIALYYQIRNARNANPLFLFYRMHYIYDEIGKEAPQNGWIRTRVDAKAFTAFLKTVMTEEHAARFAAGFFETEGDAKLLYRVPDEEPELIRLSDLKDNGDGTWTAFVLRFVSPSEWVPDSETFTMVQIGGEWFVDRVE